jgi:glycosyltransferase involved in cell wall biosynthesis
MNNINIAILSNSLEIGGAEQQSLLLCKALHPYFDTWLLVINGNLVDDQYKKFIQDENLNVSYLKGSLLKRSIFLIKFFKKNHTLIVFSFLLKGNFFGSICGKIAAVRYIFGGIRNSKFPTIKLILQLLLHWLFQFKTITNNYSAVPYLSKRLFNKNKLITIPNCVMVPDDASSGATSPGYFKILTVARFEDQKDFNTSIKAIALLRSKLPKEYLFRYIIIGYGSLINEIRNYIKESGIENYVELIIKPSNLKDYFRNSDIYLSSSLYEGLSNSIMEAMSYGLAIVATNVGDNGILVTHESNGFLVNPKDYGKIAEKLEFLIKNPDILYKMRKLNRKKIINEFSFESFQKRYINLVYDCQKT